MKINKYKQLGSGWHNQSQRHSNAKKYGIAGGLYDNQLYLDTELSDISKSKTQKQLLKEYGKHFGKHRNKSMMFVIPTVYPKKTFITTKTLKNLDYNNPDNIRGISNAIGHEELHQVLKNEFNFDTGKKLDNISVSGNISKDKKYIKNPRTIASVNPEVERKMSDVETVRQRANIDKKSVDY